MDSSPSPNAAAEKDALLERQAGSSRLPVVAMSPCPPLSPAVVATRGKEVPAAAETQAVATWAALPSLEATPCDRCLGPGLSSTEHPSRAEWLTLQALLLVATGEPTVSRACEHKTSTVLSWCLCISTICLGYDSTPCTPVCLVAMLEAEEDFQSSKTVLE